MRKFPSIECFWGLLHTCFTSVKSVGAGIEIDVKNIRGVKSTKIERIFKQKCVNKTS